MRRSHLAALLVVLFAVPTAALIARSRTRSTASSVAPVLPALPPFVFEFPRSGTAGGHVVRAPNVVAITFAGDEMAQAVVDFNQRLVSSRYFAAAADEYGVGAIGRVAHVVADGPAPKEIENGEIREWLVHELETATRLGPPDASTLYAIYYPRGTTVHYGGSQSCDFGGYHGEVAVANVRVGFAVLPRCEDDAVGTSLEKLTTVASHEYFEWATDPYPQSDEAWHEINPRFGAWGIAFFPELADLCDETTAFAVPPDLGYRVQSVWSNEASASGRDPCQPARTGPFVTAIPDLPDQLELPLDGLAPVMRPRRGSAPGVRLAAGVARAVPVFLYAETATDTLLSVDVKVRGGHVRASLDRTIAKGGDELALTLTADHDFRQATVGILYVRGENRPTARWPFLVAP